MTNCRRSDPERMLRSILEGVAASRAAAARITLKLHPADSPTHYEQIIARHGQLDVRVLHSGDVGDLFASTDVYITTYSTSLLEAASAGLPFVYYRVNEQQLHPPFSADAVMSAHTVTSALELTRVLDHDAPPAMPAGDDTAAWVERYSGPSDGHNTTRLDGGAARGSGRLVARRWHSRPPTCVMFGASSQAAERTGQPRPSGATPTRFGGTSATTPTWSRPSSAWTGPRSAPTAPRPSIWGVDRAGSRRCCRGSRPSSGSSPGTALRSCWARCCHACSSHSRVTRAS